jgi:hypothetical protein
VRHPQILTAQKKEKKKKKARLFAVRLTRGALQRILYRAPLVKRTTKLFLCRAPHKKRTVIFLCRAPAHDKEFSTI